MSQAAGTVCFCFYSSFFIFMFRFQEKRSVTFFLYIFKLRCFHLIFWHKQPAPFVFFCFLLFLFTCLYFFMFKFQEKINNIFSIFKLRRFHLTLSQAPCIFCFYFLFIASSSPLLVFMFNLNKKKSVTILYIQITVFIYHCHKRPAPFVFFSFALARDYMHLYLNISSWYCRSAEKRKKVMSFSPSPTRSSAWLCITLCLVMKKRKALLTDYFFSFNKDTRKRNNII